MVRTMPLALGFHAATVLLASTRAMFVRETAPTALNCPPMYQPPAPSGSALSTVPVTRGKPAAGSAVVISTGTPAPVTGPTKEKLPPR